MALNGKPYLRKKINKWIIEKKVRVGPGQLNTVYLGTLPPLEDVLEWLASRKASFSYKGTIPKPPKKAPKSSHNIRYANPKTVTPELTDEEIEASLKEVPDGKNIL